MTATVENHRDRPRPLPVAPSGISDVAASVPTLLRERLSVRRERDRLVDTFDAIPAGLLVLDRSRVVRRANVAATKMLGESLEERSWAEITADVDWDEGRLRQRDGNATLSIRYIPLPNSEEELVWLTEVDDRRGRLAAIGERAAAVVHQLRTPLTSALLNVARLERGAAGGASAHRVRTRLMDITRMLDDLLRFAAGRPPTIERLLVADLFAALNDTYANRVEAGDLRLPAVDRGAAINGNADAVRGAISNLIDNALDASPAEPKVEVRCAVGRDRITVIVADNGPGISRDVRSRLFEPFYSTRSRGTGLGLYVVKSVANSHGGSIDVISDGDGSRFSLTLPAAGDSV